MTKASITIRGLSLKEIAAFKALCAVKQITIENKIREMIVVVLTKENLWGHGYVQVV